MVCELASKLMYDSRPLDKVIHELIVSILDYKPLFIPPLINIIDIILVSILLRLLPLKGNKKPLPFKCLHILLVHISVFEHDVDCVDQVDDHYGANDNEKDDGANDFGGDLWHDVSEDDEEDQASEIQDLHGPHIHVQPLFLIRPESISPHNSKHGKEHNNSVPHRQALSRHAVTENKSPEEEVNDLKHSNPGSFINTCDQHAKLLSE